MAAGTQWTNNSLRAEASCSHSHGLMKALEMGKILKIASTQGMDSGLMDVL